MGTMDLWTWWKRADDGRTTLGFPAAAIVDVGESGEVTPNQWSTLLWPDTIEVLPLGESAAVEIGTWSGTLAARQTLWEARAGLDHPHPRSNPLQARRGAPVGRLSL